MDVWCDSRSEESSQSFVLWAGSLLQNGRAPVWTSLFEQSCHGGSIRSHSWEVGYRLWPLLSLHICALLLPVSPVVIAPFEPCCGVQGGL